MFRPFEILQYMSDHAGRLRHDLASSGVPPLRLAEFLALAGLAPDFLDQAVLRGPPGCGAPGLRARIAALYPGAAAGNVLITAGATEATRTIADALLEPGGEVVVITPAYRQLAGSALNAGVAVREMPLVAARGWALDRDALAAAVGPRTRLIQVVNPHNPTGHVLDADETAAIVAAAARHGAWILADEVFAGAERDGRPPTPTLWGQYDRVLAVGGLSKAYGLAGLRIGWVVAPEAMVGPLWRRHEYLTITAPMLDSLLAEAALAPGVRGKLLARGRAVAQAGFEVVARELLGGGFSAVAPQASVVSFVRYDLPLSSAARAARLRARDVLAVPGSLFGAEGFLRVGGALPPDALRAALRVVRALAEELRGSLTAHD
jgi:aspartate/methionine/tyrosine aminotransferase